MENGGGKKARVEVPNGSNLAVQVKREALRQEVGGEIVVAAAAAKPRAPLAVTFDRPVLDCRLCSSPLKPPVFQCGAGHTACSRCYGKLPSNRCQKCVVPGDGASYGHNHVLDSFVLAAKVRCPYEAYGCWRPVSYCWVGDHQRVCSHAPCPCPEPGCDFLGSPPKLKDHLVAEHAWQMTLITYVTVHVIAIPATERHHLLVSEAGQTVFLLASVDLVGDGGRCVSLARVRANVPAAGSRHKWKVWTQAAVDPKSGYKDTVMVDAEVRICAAPSTEAAVATEGATVLSVPPWMLHGDSKEMILRIRIERIRKHSLVEAAAPAPTPAVAASPSS